jgi:hypothetical protein
MFWKATTRRLAHQVIQRDCHQKSGIMLLVVIIIVTIVSADVDCQNVYRFRVGLALFDSYNNQQSISYS